MPPSKSSDHFSPPQDSAGCACRAHHQLLTRATGVSEGNGVTLLRMVRNEERTYMYVGHTHIYIYYICTCTFFNISIRYIHTDSMVNVLHTPMKRIHALIYIYIYRTLRTLPSFAMLGSEGLEWATNNPWTNVCLIEGYPVNCCKHGTSQNRQQTDLFRGWHYLVYI